MCYKTNTVDYGDMSKKIEEDSAQAFKYRMQFATHDSTCIFRRKPSPRYFLFFAKRERVASPTIDPEEYYDQISHLNLEFAASFRSLYSALSITPTLSEEFKNKHSDLYTKMDKVAKQKMDIITPQPLEDVNRAVYCFFVTLFGWKTPLQSLQLGQSVEKQTTITLHCSFCQTSKTVHTPTKSVSIHPEHDHRWWCPCIRSVEYTETEVTKYDDIEDKVLETSSRNIREVLPGWEQYLEALSIDKHALDLNPKHESMIEMLRKRYDSGMFTYERLSLLQSMVSNLVSPLSKRKSFTPVPLPITEIRVPVDHIPQLDIDEEIERDLERSIQEVNDSMSEAYEKPMEVQTEQIVIFEDLQDAMQELPSDSESDAPNHTPMEQEEERLIGLLSSPVSPILAIPSPPLEEVQEPATPEPVEEEKEVENPPEVVKQLEDVKPLEDIQQPIIFGEPQVPTATTTAPVTAPKRTIAPKVFTGRTRPKPPIGVAAPVAPTATKKRTIGAVTKTKTPPNKKKKKFTKKTK
jgi:hypothetical protein